MKIVNRQEFLALPSEVLYQKYSPCITGQLAIKVGNCGENDWVHQPVDGIDIDTGDMNLFDFLDDMSHNKKSRPLDLTGTMRDGEFVEDQLFLVFEKDDVLHLIKCLQKILIEGMEL